MAAKDTVGIHPAGTRTGDPYGGEHAAAPATGRRYFTGFNMRTVTGNVPEEHLDRVTINLAVYGAGLVLVGLFAILFPIIFALAMAKLISWLLIFGGAMALVQFFCMCGAPGTSSFLLLGALHLLIGLMIIIYPLRSGLLVMVMAFWFLLHGVFKILMSFQLRSFIIWPALSASGVLAVILSFIVLVLAPRLGLTFLSVVIGSDLLLSGVCMLLISWISYFGKRTIITTTETSGTSIGAREPLMSGMSHAAASA